MQTFTSLDVNKDGKLSKEELVTGYRQIMSDLEAEEEAERIMKEVNVDSNGFIEYSQFVMASIEKSRLLSMKNIEDAFACFDLDGSGTISAVKLRTVLSNGKESDEGVWDELIQKVDQNGDGEIDIKEFKEMMVKLF